MAVDHKAPFSKENSASALTVSENSTALSAANPGESGGRGDGVGDVRGGGDGAGGGGDGDGGHRGEFSGRPGGGGATTTTTGVAASSRTRVFVSVHSLSEASAAATSVRTDPPSVTCSLIQSMWVWLLATTVTCTVTGDVPDAVVVIWDTSTPIAAARASISAACCASP